LRRSTVEHPFAAIKYRIFGLPLGPPWLTPEDGKKIGARLAGIRQQTGAGGFRYDILHASPNKELTELRQRLRAGSIDALLIGGGVAADPKLASFKQQIIDAARDEAPRQRYWSSTIPWRCRSW